RIALLNGLSRSRGTFIPPLCRIAVPSQMLVPFAIWTAEMRVSRGVQLSEEGRLCTAPTFFLGWHLPSLASNPRPIDLVILYLPCLRGRSEWLSHSKWLNQSDLHISSVLGLASGCLARPVFCSVPSPSPAG